MSRNLPSLALLIAMLALPAGAVCAADTEGLDLTIEVLGKNETIDERIVNRIEVPGVSAQGQQHEPVAILSPVVEPVAPVLQAPLSVVQDLARDALQLLRSRDDAAP